MCAERPHSHAPNTTSIRKPEELPFISPHALYLSAEGPA